MAHAMQGTYMNSSSAALLSPEERKVKANIALVLKEIDSFNAKETDFLRKLCCQVFPKQKRRGANIPVAAFTDKFNERFLTSFTPNDVKDMMRYLGQDPSNGVQAFKFFTSVKATALPNSSYWTEEREDEINMNLAYVKSERPGSFERVLNDTHTQPLTLESELELKEILEERLGQYTTKDIDRFRQVFFRLDIKADAHNHLSQDKFRKHIFSKFGFAMKPEDVDKIAAKYPAPGGRIDFRAFIASLLVHYDNQQLPITQFKNNENYERRMQRLEREKFYRREKSTFTLHTVDSVRKILRQKIAELSSRDTDQYRQFFKRLGNTTHVTKEALFGHLWTVFHLNVHPALADEVFHTIDTNGDGYMELGELVAFLKNEQRFDAEDESAGGSTMGASTRWLGSTRMLGAQPSAASLGGEQLAMTWSSGELLARPTNGRRRTSVTTNKTLTDRGVSIQDLLTGTYDPALGGQRAKLQSSAGYPRLVTTPPPPRTAGPGLRSPRAGLGLGGGASRPATAAGAGALQVSRPPTSGGRPPTSSPRAALQGRTPAPSSGRDLPALPRHSSWGGGGEPQVEGGFPGEPAIPEGAEYRHPAVSPIRQTALRSALHSRAASSSRMSQRLRTPMRISSKMSKAAARGAAPPKPFMGSNNNLMPSPPQTRPQTVDSATGGLRPVGSAGFFKRPEGIARQLLGAGSKAMTAGRLVGTEGMLGVAPGGASPAIYS